MHTRTPPEQSFLPIGPLLCKGACNADTMVQCMKRPGARPGCSRWSAEGKREDRCCVFVARNSKQLVRFAAEARPFGYLCDHAARPAVGPVGIHRIELELPNDLKVHDVVGAKP